MMRVIDNPTMVHDGSAFGALAGATALDLAEMGFTGAPAITVEAEEVDPVWRNLGETWAVSHHYMKPYPVCRWTHALIDGALLLKRTHAIRAEDIAAIELTSFHEATRLYREVPATTPVAQYAVSFPVASALVKGRLGVEEIAGAGLLDPEAARLVAATTVREADRYNERFPAGRWGDVTLVLKDGRRLNSGELNARGGPDNPMAEDEILAKFHEYAEPVLGVSRSRTIEEAVRRLADPDSDATGLIELVCRA
jgi:2-methylcitrate dehydratase PrpD